MNLSLKRVVAVLGLASLLGGCGVMDMLTDSNKIDYKSAGKLPPLDIPPDLVGPRADERFLIPDRSSAQQRTLSGFQSARAVERPVSAEGGRVLPVVEGVRVERAGNQRWLVTTMAPDRVFSLVREFWQESGFLIQTEMPEAGILETDWAENRAKLPQDVIRRTLGRVLDTLYSTGERDKFRTRLDRSADGGTEIFISHRGLVEVYNSQLRESTVWTPRPADPELEAEFLRRLMVKLGADQQRARAQIAAASPAAPSASAGSVAAVAGAPERARLVTVDGLPQVQVLEPFDRAWRRVGLALDRGGFTVEDRDRSQGVFFVRYIDSEIEAKNSGKRSFFSDLFKFGDARPASAQQYQVRLTAEGETTRVAVLLRDGKPMTADNDRQTANKIVGLLRDQLQ